MAELSWQDKLVVAAIDFGTTYSGFVISLWKEYREDKSKVLTHEWALDDGSRTVKTSTCLLLMPDGTFDSFGYDAEEKYAELSCKGEHKDWHFFRRFKMELYREDKPALTLETTVDDAERRPYKAMLVFEHSIRFFKNTIEDIVRESVAGEENSVHYVLTTPAIWSEESKEFMRSAAVHAGIPNERLRIGLEPECAALYVKTKWLPIVQSHSASRAFQRGAKHMLVDMGGGTIDIAIHQINQNDTLDELIPPGGGPWGSDNINILIKQLIVSLVGAEAFIRFKDEQREDYLRLTQSIESTKRRLKSKDATICLPQSLRDLHKSVNMEDLTKSVSQTPFALSLQVIQDKLRINNEFIRKHCFGDIIDNIVQKIKDITTKMPVDAIICVGGFSESEILKDKIKKEFSDRFEVIFPPDPVSAIMKGAVIYGRDVREIAYRVCRFTYGLDWNEDFNEQTHDKGKKEYADGGYVCADIFRKLVSKGDHVPYDGISKTVEASTKSRYQTSIEFPFYRSEINDDPMYVDVPGCVHIGSLEVQLDDSNSPHVDLTVVFTGTELKAEATDHRGRKVQAKFNILGSTRTDYKRVN